MAQWGMLAALSAALLWTLNSVTVERRGVGFDSAAINLARLVLGFVLVTVAAAVMYGSLLPLDASPAIWGWLILSGLIGFSLGDTLLFGAFQAIGARLTMLVFSFAPVLTALMSYLFFGERLSGANMLGMALVLGGILLVIGLGDAQRRRDLARGLLFAATASLTQAIANITSKLALSDISALFATQVRLIGGIAGMLVLFAIRSSWGSLRQLRQSADGRLVVLSGGVIGTFLGVLLSMLALQLTQAAIASTLTSTMPVLILPISYFVLKEKLKPKDLLGALMTVAGLAVLFF